VLSDFGITLRLVANRLQQTYNTATAADLFLIDPPNFAVASMSGFATDVLGKLGHSDNRMISNTWMTKCFREDAHGMVGDIDISAAVLDAPV
jgi:hypothetical protein